MIIIIFGLGLPEVTCLCFYFISLVRSVGGAVQKRELNGQLRMMFCASSLVLIWLLILCLSYLLLCSF